MAEIVTTSMVHELPKLVDLQGKKVVVLYRCPQPDCGTKFEHVGPGAPEMFCARCLAAKGLYQKLKFEARLEEIKPYKAKRKSDDRK